MNKYLLILFLFFISISVSFAQKHDYNWIIGYVKYNPSLGNKNGKAIVNFQDSTTIKVDTLIANISFLGCAVSFSDSSGKSLLFYSSGLELYNSKNNILENSDSLSPGKYWDSYRKLGKQPCIGGFVNIPIYYPDSLIVFIFHYGTGDSDSSHQIRTSLWLTKVIFSKEYPLGIVKEKNINLIIDSDLENPKAVMHANGKDWWIVIGENFTGKNYCYLLQDGILQKPVIYDLPEKFNYYTSNISLFNPEGSKFVRHSNRGVIIYDFNRCTGEISNPQKVLFPSPQNVGGGSIFSSNSQWLYLTARRVLWQIDMTKFPYTIDTAAIITKPGDPIVADMTFGALGPDGKIYIETGNTTTFMHVMNDPDKGCPDCNFVEKAIELPVYNGYFSRPTYPNYRLGPLNGSGCDTVSTFVINKPKEKLNIYPNPASDYFRIEYTGSSGFQKEMELQLIDMSGKVVLKEHLAVYSLYRNVDVTGLAPGMYFWQVKDKLQLIQSGKIVVIK